MEAKELANTLADKSGSTNENISVLTAAVGSKSESLSEKYDAPSLWSSIDNLATCLDTTPVEVLPTFVKKLEAAKAGIDNILKKQAKKIIKDSIKQDIESERSKNLFMMVLTSLNNKMNKEGVSIDVLTAEVNSVKEKLQVSKLKLNLPGYTSYNPTAKL